MDHTLHFMLVSVYNMTDGAIKVNDCLTIVDPEVVDISVTTPTQVGTCSSNDTRTRKLLPKPYTCTSPRLSSMESQQTPVCLQKPSLLWTRGSILRLRTNLPVQFLHGSLCNSDF